ncbi:hypothetical protein DOY81_007520 [Sarcophaga bullata]|nr:hypothetical protein DOY81_007520 [Sarcophaga bullata]
MIMIMKMIMTQQLQMLYFAAPAQKHDSRIVYLLNISEEDTTEKSSTCGTILILLSVALCILTLPFSLLVLPLK